MVAFRFSKIKRIWFGLWRLDLQQSVLLLVMCWLGVAVVTVTAGFIGQLHLPLYWLLLMPLAFLFLVLKAVVSSPKSYPELLAMLALVGIWLIHATGLLVPETGFDAIWYHLPVIKRFLELGQIVYLSDYYQSLNPFISDALLLLGFQAVGELGAKVVAYLLGLSLLVTCYTLARLWLNQFWSLCLIITLSLIQPYAWQVTSAYIDVAKAYWEIAMVYLMVLVIRKEQLFIGRYSIPHRYLLVLAGLLFGASLGTKLFSILLLPALLLAVLVLRRKLSDWWWFMPPALFLAIPFYLFSWLHTGDPWHGISVPVANLDEIGGQVSASVYVWERMKTLPFSGWYLVVQARDYVSILLLIWLPLLVIFFTKKRAKEICLLAFFAATQWGLWWFVPPVSTRYALSGFIVLLLLYFVAAAEYEQSLQRWGKLAIVSSVIVASLWHLAPRLLVARRNLRYLTEQQTTQTYLQQFTDGTIDHHLEKWYQVELD